MEIRIIASHELNDLLKLYSYLHRADEPLPEQKIVDSIWEELLSNQRYKYIGGYVNNQLIASCTLTVIPNLTRACRPYGIIENVVTHEDHRNKGYGKKILAYTLSLAWTQNCYKVVLTTGRKDEATLRFYESAGFNRHEKQAFIAKPKT